MIVAAITSIVWLGVLIILFLKHKRILNQKDNKIILDQKSLISEKELHQNELNMANERISLLKKLAIVTEQTENAVMLMDASGNIEWVNDSFTRMYEYSYDEFISDLGDNIKKTSFNPKIIERLNRCINSKQSVTYEALNISKTGKRLWTHTSLIPLVENDAVIGLVTVDSDVHKRIAASEMLIEHVMSFNHKLEKITEQLNVMVELTNVLFERIDKSQQRIEKTDQIISYVKGISDQTKILGINASIEAHSAGVHGKGFRIIANEMVSISNLTIQSLKEINGLISSVKKSSDKLGNERERSEAAIVTHRNLVDELKSEISEVESVVNQLKA